MNMEIYSSIYKSPLGKIRIEAEENKITKVSFVSEAVTEEKPNEATLECKKQLQEYFDGKRQKFEIDYKLQGTEFQCKVWEELLKIPYGKVVAYKDVAERIGNKKGVRAVANAIGSNNLLIIVPCHRVIGSNGKPTGFSGKTDDKTGLELKQELLELEGIVCK